MPDKEIKIPRKNDLLHLFMRNSYHRVRAREEGLLASIWPSDISEKIPDKYSQKKVLNKEHYQINVFPI